MDSQNIKYVSKWNLGKTMKDRSKNMFRSIVNFFIFIFLGMSSLISCNSLETRWYKGNIHTHSLWSDGDDFLEMAAIWYKSHGYHFVSFTEHNTVPEGERWVYFPSHYNRADYTEKFGNWLQEYVSEKDNLVRLHTLQEVKERLEKKDEFLLIEGMELTAPNNVHFNLIPPPRHIDIEGGSTVDDTFTSCLKQIDKAEFDKNVIVTINHPNWEWTLRAKHLVEAKNIKFLEVCNNCVESNNQGDSKHNSLEEMWDIANTIRLLKNIEPLYAVASDDAHNYSSQDVLNALPGRGWIMVLARELSSEAIREAMLRGDFYASTGVSLEKLSFDGKQLYIKVTPQPGVSYKITFVGSLKETKPDQFVLASGPKCAYPESACKILSQIDDTQATYSLTGKELYVRAVVTSNRICWQYKETICWQQAWTQPVGWTRRMEK